MLGSRCIPSYFVHAFREAFERTSREQADFLVAPAIDNQARTRNASLRAALDAASRAQPIVTFFLLDRWDADGKWSQSARTLARRSILCFGHQLPLSELASNGRPLLLPSRL